MTYLSMTKQTPIIFRAWDSMSEARLDRQIHTSEYHNTFTPPNPPPRSPLETQKALLHHLTYTSYARCWTSFTKSASDAIHHAQRLHKRRKGVGTTYLSAIRTDILHFQCSLQDAKEMVDIFKVDLSHYTDTSNISSNEVLLSGSVPNESVLDIVEIEGSIFEVEMAVQTWLRKLLPHAQNKLGLGPDNPFAKCVSLWQE